jgi:hypothetical protein
VRFARASHDPETKAYLARKEAEGKTTKGALRCLKRTLARRFYHLLSLPAQPTTPDYVDRTIAGSAPAPVICVTYRNPQTATTP